MEKIIKLKPALVEKIWGGKKLKEHYGKNTDLDTIGESWEVSCHKNGMSTVASGPHTGLSLESWIAQCDTNPLGTKCSHTSVFPLLIKFIDAADALSIQVHPGDAYAKRIEHALGKTETWLVLEADPNAYLYYGLNQDVTPQEFQTHIKNNTILDILNKVPVHKGDVFFIEAGTVHAIGAGIVICEIQQNSDTTYRVYDFNRTDEAGNTRELHIQKAADVSTLAPPTRAPGPVGLPLSISGGSHQRLAACPYFLVESYDCQTRITLPVTDESFLCLTCLGGSGTASVSDNQQPFSTGDSLFVAAGLATLQIEGPCRLVVTRL